VASSGRKALEMLAAKGYDLRHPLGRPHRPGSPQVRQVQGSRYGGDHDFGLRQHGNRRGSDEPGGL
jgi:hypothetical protein